MFNARVMLLSVAVLTSSFSLTSYAQSPKAQIFKTACVDTWMKNISSGVDKISFKNFGEKFCACAANILADKETIDDNAKKEATSTCMSQTLLHDTLDNIDDKDGLKKATPEKIQKGCEAEWAILSPTMGDEAKKRTGGYCECATPKLMEIAKKQDSITEDEYKKQVDAVAAECVKKIQ